MTEPPSFELETFHNKTKGILTLNDNLVANIYKTDKESTKWSFHSCKKEYRDEIIEFLNQLEILETIE